MKALGKKPSRPTETIQLGDPALLDMDMSEAAEHFESVPLHRAVTVRAARRRESSMRLKKLA